MPIFNHCRFPDAAFLQPAGSNSGAIVIQAVWHNISLRKINQYRDITRLDYSTAIAAMVGVLAFGLLEGLVIAALIGLVSFLTSQEDSNS
ncbi:MAG: hypothetical protein R3293_25925 [Candidatus Promineifilaceae bacterium]|nr:hypothetical protein [Candidatus Promineifilaceae bacterium]